MKKIIAGFIFILILLLLPAPVFARGSSDNSGSGSGGLSSNLLENVDNAFYYVIDIISGLVGYFTNVAMHLAKIVLLIAICSAALNYALTGQGLKENIIKILKAVVFFFIIIFAYPSIIGWITNFTYNMAYGSVGQKVENEYRFQITETRNTYSIPRDVYANLLMRADGRQVDSESRTITTIRQVETDLWRKLSNIKTMRSGAFGSYTVMTPSALISVVFLVAEACFNFADRSEAGLLGGLSNALKGAICGFFAIFTGVFAILEYIICFLEFIFVASVGIILFPLSLWDVSKPWAEKFISAIIGFFLKLLFCNIAVFLLVWGYLGMIRYITVADNFTGQIGEMIFIIFSSLLFFYIIKSVPGMAQGLLNGSPNLSATGAISAAAGAVSGALAVRRLAGKTAETGIKTAKEFQKAGQNAHKVRSSVGGVGGVALGGLAFVGSLGLSAAKGAGSTLVRSLTGTDASSTWRSLNSGRSNSGSSNTGGANSGGSRRSNSGGSSSAGGGSGDASAGSSSSAGGGSGDASADSSSSAGTRRRRRRQ